MMGKRAWWPVALLTLAGPLPAAEAVTKFADLQSGCVAVASLHLEPGGGMVDCRMTRSRWVSTIGNVDFYQAQYCLGAGCQRRALLIYSNRAYAPEAQVLLERVDPAGTEYVDPLVVSGADGPHLVLRWHPPAGGEERAIYRWQEARWQPVDARQWRGEIPD